MLRKTLILALLIVLLTACAPQAAPTVEVIPTNPVAPAMTYTDSLGREITLEGTPQRIVSLAPSNTEILFAIGAGVRLG